MTRILIEPTEMHAAASTLLHTADELSGIGTQARHDCTTCLPSQAEVIADAAIGLVDQILTTLAADLASKAGDLLNRGATAAADSLTVAATAETAAMPFGAGNFVTGPAVSGGLVVGATSPTTSSFGTGPAVTGGLVVGATSPTTSSFGTGPAVAGGLFLGATSPDAPIFGSPTGWTGPSPSQAWGTGGASGFIGAGAAGQDLSFILEPSRGELIDRSGVFMSPEEYNRRGFRGVNE